MVVDVARTTLTLAMVVLSMTSARARADARDLVIFPADAGHLNVRDFGAKGDGVSDDTQAINAALAASGGDTGWAVGRDRIVYLPNGTYVVSAPLLKRYADGRFGCGLILVGQSQQGTILRLRDHAPGYQDATQPRAVVFTSSKLLSSDPKGGGRDYQGLGEGNDAYQNIIENLTIDVGRDNRGAIGIDYLANNMGAVRHVRIVAAEGSGTAGISMKRKWPGPALIKDVRVEGFDVGIDVAQTEYGMTLEDIELTGQRVVSLRNDHNMLAVHQLRASGAPTALANVSPDGLIVLTAGALSGSSEHVVDNHGHLNVRNVRVDAKRPTVVDGLYDAELRKAVRASQRWSLPIKDFAVPALEAPEAWASVTAFGAVGDGKSDATEGIRRAFASGKATVYFPHGDYLISDNITVPASVQRIVGMTSMIGAHPQRQASFDRERGMFRLANSRAPLLVEKLGFDHSNKGPQAGVEAIGTQPVLLRDVYSLGAGMLKRPVAGGEVFLENTCCSVVELEGTRGVWARQLNSEGRTVRIRNHGAPLWILGLKTEKNATIIENTDGARTEVLGALIYMVQRGDQPALPAFVNRNARLVLSYVEEAFNASNSYSVHLENTRRGKRVDTLKSALLRRNAGTMVPLLSAD